MTPEQGQQAILDAPWGGTIAVVEGLARQACPYCAVAPELPCALHRPRYLEDLLRGP